MKATTWKSFTLTCLASVLLSLFVLIAFIFVIDPYDNLPFSPNLRRAPMCSNQRFSYPMLTKRQEFDSAIFGTSTARLMQPKILNDKFNAKFVNLSMDSASTYEQYKLFQLFIKHHPNPKLIIFGIDAVWCERGEELNMYSGRPFPTWMYDDNPWTHPIHLLNTNTLIQAFRQFGFIAGKKEARFGLDGYANFLYDDSKYDIEKAREYLYPSSRKVADTNIPENFESNINIKPLAFMQEIIKQLPESTQVIFMFVPYHYHYQPSEKTCDGVALKYCKSKFIELAKAHPNVQLLDFMIHSNITSKDENYWDPLHYNLKTAGELMNLIQEGVLKKSSKLGFYHYYGKDS